MRLEMIPLAAPEAVLKWRVAALVSAVAVAFVSAFVERHGLHSIWVAGPLAFLAVVAATPSSPRVIDDAVQPLPPRFMDLSRPLRSDALDLAWAQLIVLPRLPEFRPSRAPVIEVAAAVTFMCTLGILVGAPRLESGWPQGVLAMILTSLWLLAGVALMAMYKSVCTDEFAAYSQAMTRHREGRYDAHLRSLAVGWVTSHAEGWRKRAEQLASQRALTRFKADANSAKVFTLLSAGDAPVPDLPPARWRIFALLVGPFLATRDGFAFDLKQTSYDVAAGGNIATGEDRPVEREFHYADVVTVEYVRVSAAAGAQATGQFKLSLVNAQTEAQECLEQGAESAVEAIRLKTRAVRAA